jgi:hypothetical protein
VHTLVDRFDSGSDGASGRIYKKNLITPRRTSPQAARACRTRTLAGIAARPSNVGTDKDGEKRQRVAIEAFAKRAGMDIVDWFYDPAVSGATKPRDATPFLRERTRTICTRAAARAARTKQHRAAPAERIRSVATTLANEPNAK